MQNVVYKYQIPIAIDFDQSKPLYVALPAGAQILSAAFQIPPRRPDPGEAPPLFLWAQISRNEKIEVPRGIYVIGTGRDMPDDDIRFVCTVHCDPTHEVFHIFEKISKAHLS